MRKRYFKLFCEYGASPEMGIKEKHHKEACLATIAPDEEYLWSQACLFAYEVLWEAYGLSHLSIVECQGELKLNYWWSEITEEEYKNEK